MARNGRKTPSATTRLILDSGAIIALSRGDQRVRAYLARARELRAVIVVPVVVIAETTRGTARDASVNRVLLAVGESPSATSAMARRAGALLGAAGSSATVDALVIAQALEDGGGVILTSDPDDLGRLASGHPEVSISAVARLR